MLADAPTARRWRFGLLDDGKEPGPHAALVPAAR